MKISNAVKGYGFVLIGVLAMSNVYIFSKAALNKIHLSQFGVYWFGFALIITVVFNRKKLSIKILKQLPKKCYKILLAVGILELSGTSLFFLSIKLMSNPALVSFMSNSTPVFVTAMGLIFLRERFTAYEFLGMFVTVIGSFIIAYNPGLEFPDDFYLAIGLTLLSGILYATSTIIVKKKIDKISTAILTLNRISFLFVASLIFLFLSQKSFYIPKEAVLNTLLGAFLGPFLAAYSSYSALQYIQASKASVLGSAKAIFVLLTAWIYFSKLPTQIQIFGGILTIIGILLISTGKLLNKRK